eukprot:TRINITY_DN2188_c0_g1_i2.p1 TRINITY_DN2188_c0_g1~~TRINITY_DN2188_c0_g1_i2.p1  ORF type:complete len:503 (+),score=85.20 TRINITY_DN2188_c0_g1_i2:62-1570(+)
MLQLVTLVCGLVGIVLFLLLRKYDADLTDSPAGCHVLSGPIPFLRAGLKFVRRPKSWLDEMQQKHGDNFVVSMFGFKMFFTFSPTGLKDLYRAAEQDASFQEATRTLLQFKLPEELLAERSIKGMFASIFRRSLMEKYASVTLKSVNEHLDKLPDEGEFELFREVKEVYYRIGFRCWCGEDAVTTKNVMNQLIASFEELDPEKGFVSPIRLLQTILTQKSKERRAFREIARVLKTLWLSREKDVRYQEENDTLSCLHQAYAHLPQEEKYREVATDVFILQMASNANLYAGLTWTIINLLQHPSYLHKVIREYESVSSPGLFDAKETSGVSVLNAIDQLEFLEQCINESLRIAQQSITLRKVLSPEGVLVDGFRVPKDYYVVTLLSVLNTSDTIVKPVVNEKNETVLPTDFYPERYARGSGEDSKLPYLLKPGMEYSISTFGHGRHACPGNSFAMLVIKIVVIRFITKLQLKPKFSNVFVPETQIGGVGRANQPCHVYYKKAK